MLVEPWVILIVLPLVVYSTRLSGVLLSRYISRESKYYSTLSLLPICAMLAFFIPSALAGSNYEVAVLIGFAILFWFTNNSMLSISLGIIAIVVAKLYL